MPPRATAKSKTTKKTSPKKTTKTTKTKSSTAAKAKAKEAVANQTKPAKVAKTKTESRSKQKRKAAEKVYEVTITGNYFAHVKGGNELKPYTETVNMNETHKEAGFLSVFKNLVAPKIMRDKYPDYGDGLATHTIVSVIDKADPEAMPNDPMLMNLTQLMAFIKHNELPVETGLYKDEDELKQAVVQCIEDEDAFEKQQKLRRETRTKDLEMTNELAALNPEISGGLGNPNTDDIDEDTIPDADDVDLPTKQPTETDGEDRFGEEFLDELDEEIEDDDLDI